MLKRLISALISFLMLFSSSAPQLFGLPKKAAKNTLDLSKFTLTWQDEFDGDTLNTDYWSYEWWITERKGGYWHEDMVSVEDGNLVIRCDYKDHWWGGDAVITGIHYDGYGEDEGSDSIGKLWIDNDPYTEYNTYGVEWNENEYIFYINGHETGRLSTGGVSQNPEFLLLSVEVAGHDGIADADRHGTGKITKTPQGNWPVEFKVDYVRVYQYNDKLPTQE